MKNNTLQLANQSAYCLAYKHKPYSNNHHTIQYLFRGAKWKKKMPEKKSRKCTAVDHLSTFNGTTSSNYVVIPCMYVNTAKLSESIELLQENCYNTVKTKTGTEKDS